MKRWLLVLLAALSLTGCGYNDFQRLDEQTKSAWSEVLNQYQRRADLVPNLVATVKGEANFEQETLTKVIEARAKATSIQVTPETLNDPAAFQKFQQAQSQLSGALSRLWRSAPTRSPPTPTPRTGTAVTTGPPPRRRACRPPGGRGRRNPKRHPTRSRPCAPTAVAAARGRPPTSSTRAPTQAAGGGPGRPSTASPTTRTPAGTTAPDGAGVAPPVRVLGTAPEYARGACGP